MWQGGLGHRAGWGPGGAGWGGVLAGQIGGRWYVARKVFVWRSKERAPKQGGIEILEKSCSGLEESCHDMEKSGKMQEKRNSIILACWLGGRRAVDEGLVLLLLEGSVAGRTAAAPAAQLVRWRSPLCPAPTLLMVQGGSCFDLYRSSCS